MRLPLSGMRIIAVEQYGAGPFGTQHLADLGAEVIKIENPADGGDVGRLVGPYFFGPKDSHFFQSFNRNKKSFSLNLKTEEGREVFHDLVRSADGVTNNLRGDLPEKLGVTYDQLKEFNPAIVCAHLTAYGREGSRKAWPGYDYLMQAEAGYLSLTGEPDAPPSRFGVSIIDMMTGVTSMFSLLAGIIQARETGVGCDADVCLYDVAMHNLSYVGTWYLNEGVVQGREPRSGHPSLVPSQLFKTSDGWIFIMCNKEKFWGVLSEVVGKPEWADDPELNSFDVRLKNREKVTQLLDEVLSTAKTEEWIKKFGGRVPISPVYNVGEALENPFAEERGAILEQTYPDGKKVRTPACPVRFPGVDYPKSVCPEIGANTEEILLGLGYGPEKLESLKSKKVI